MGKAIEKAERQITLLGRATVLCLLLCSALVLVLGVQTALVATRLRAARMRLEEQCARRAELARSLELAPPNSVVEEPAEQLSAEAAFAILATSIGELTKERGTTVRTLRRAEFMPQESNLRAPPGYAQVTAELNVDTTYRSTLELLRVLDTMPVPVAPTQVDLASASVSSLDRDPKLVLRLQLVAQGLSLGQGG